MPCPTGARTFDDPHWRTFGTSDATADHFFPRGHFARLRSLLERPPAEVDRMVRARLALPLAEFHEPSLLVRSHVADAHVYRLVYADAWPGRDFLVRVELEPGKRSVAHLRAHYPCDGKSGRSVAIQSESHSVTAVETETLVSCLNRTFWSAPAVDDIIGLDGGVVLIEAARDGRYHAVRRWVLQVEDKEPRASLARCAAIFGRLARFSNGSDKAPPTWRSHRVASGCD